MPERDAEGLVYRCNYFEGEPACIKEREPIAIVYQTEEKEIRKLRGFQMKQRREGGSPEEKRQNLGRNTMAAAR